MRALTHRAFSDLVAELDLTGFVRCRVRSKGRYGRMREISPSVPEAAREQILRTILLNFDIPMSKIKEVIPCKQTQLPAFQAGRPGFR